MTVWVLLPDYEYYVHGVYSTREKAEAAARLVGPGCTAVAVELDAPVAWGHRGDAEWFSGGPGSNASRGACPPSRGRS